MTSRIVLIGAGSKSFSAKVIHDLVLDRELLDGVESELVLVDVREDHLKATLEYARHCARLKKANINVTATLNRDEALRGADFVILSVAVKRMELWEQDFRVPLSFGFNHILGENGGPGALFHALRNLQVILPICADVERLCPDALLLNFTNPEARILTAILTLTKVRAVGLCHGFRGFFEFASDVLKRPLQHLDIRTAGMNHFFSCYRIRDRETDSDLYPELERRITRDPALLHPLARHLWQTFGVLGMNSDDHIGEYIPYANEFVGTRWLFGRESRAILPEERDVELTDVYDAWRFKVDLAEQMRRKKLSNREEDASRLRLPEESEVTSSGELAVAIIGDVLLDRKQHRPAVNVLNAEGYIENLARDACVEVPAVVDADGVHPESVGELPEGFAAQISLQHSIQKLVVEGYAKRSRKLLLQALLLDPLTNSAAGAEKLLDYMLEIQSDYLPELT